MEAIGDLIIEAKKRIESVSNTEGLSGVPSGFTKLDMLTNGWQDSELITIGARPSMGKTSFVISMLNNVSVNRNIPSLFFTIDSTSSHIVKKLITLETGLSLNKLNSGKLEKHEWEQLHVKTRSLEKSNLYINDTPEIFLEDLIDKIKWYVSNKNIEIVVIDYLQLIRINSKKHNAVNKEQEISVIVKKLKALSKILNIPIVLLSQLNRRLEERGGSRRPILLDLRDSGTIGEDSDIVCFLYRPEYYKIDEWDDDERSPTDDQAELIVAKNRNGGKDNIRLKFIGHLGRFDNLDDFDSPFGAFRSAMNAAANDDTFKPDNFPSPSDAFDGPEDDGVPF